MSFSYTIDIEPTNRCNAKCHFCPRDQTPHEGLMTPVVFDRALERAVEFRDVVAARGQEVEVSLCGLGEPLLNKHLPDFVRAVRAAGFTCTTSTNGARLDERRGEALLDAGLNHVYINVGEQGDDYEAVYHLPFERTRDNVVRFGEMAAGRCDVHIVLVDHRVDRDHIRRMRAYWRDLGFTSFVRYDIINRGGSLFVDHMEYEAYDEIHQARELLRAAGVNAVCGAPFGYMFVGYDGQYYLCCSDWKKEVGFGSVFEVSLLDVTAAKYGHAESREPICKTCNLDPVNVLTEELRHAAGDAAARDAVVAKLRESGETVERVVGDLEALGAPRRGSVAAPARRTIPVTAR